MNPLHQYFAANQGRLIHKWLHYFDIYHRHFEKFRHQPVTVLEIGVQHGGSLQMWKDYFGSQATIVGVDIDERCKALEEDRIEVRIGSQQDVNFLTELRSSLPRIDVVIDDGGHTMEQMTTSFECLYDAVSDNGIYLVEDLHTCYWKEYGGGYRKNSSFLEYAKGLIDQLNAWHSRDENSFAVDQFTRSTHSIHFYDSIIVFEKKPISQPEHRQTGFPSF